MVSSQLQITELSSRIVCCCFPCSQSKSWTLNCLRLQFSILPSNFSKVSFVRHKLEHCALAFAVFFCSRSNLWLRACWFLDDWASNDSNSMQRIRPCWSFLSSCRSLDSTLSLYCHNPRSRSKSRPRTKQTAHSEVDGQTGCFWKLQSRSIRRKDDTHMYFVPQWRNNNLDIQPRAFWHFSILQVLIVFRCLTLPNDVSCWVFNCFYICGSEIVPIVAAL